MKVECASAAIADWDALSDLFQNRFLRGDYKSHLMRELRERKMTENESLLSYITSIEALCHDLDSHMSEEQIIDYIYAGLDKKIAAQIAFFAPRTVEVLLDVAKNIERGLDLMHELKSKQKHKKINAVKSSDSVKARNSQTEVLKNDSLEDKLNKVVDLLQVMAVNKNNDMNRPHSNSFQTQNKNYQNKPFNKQNNYNNFKFKKILNAMLAISLVILLKIVETVIPIMQIPVMPLLLRKILRQILRNSLNKVKLL